MHGKRRRLYYFRSVFLGQEGDSCEGKTSMSNLRRLVLRMLVIWWKFKLSSCKWGPFSQQLNYMTSRLIFYLFQDSFFEYIPENDLLCPFYVPQEILAWVKYFIRWIPLSWPPFSRQLIAIVRLKKFISKHYLVPSPILCVFKERFQGHVI